MAYINEVRAYLYGRTKPTSPKEAYGEKTAAGRGYYTTGEMSDERTEEFMRSQKQSNNHFQRERPMMRNDISS